MAYWIAKLTYHITWPFWYGFFLLFFHYRFTYEDKSVQKLKSPLIIVANHSSWLDPFLISGIFPMFSAVFPIHYATYYIFFKNPAIAFFLRIHGSFPIQRGDDLAGILKPAIGFLTRRQTVGIFPGGKREQEPKIIKPGRGAAYLAANTGIELLPCKIIGSNAITFKNFLSRKNYITIYVGKPFVIKKENSLTDNAKFIADKVNELGL